MSGELRARYEDGVRCGGAARARGAAPLQLLAAAAAWREVPAADAPAPQPPTLPRRQVLHVHIPKVAASERAEGRTIEVA